MIVLICNGIALLALIVLAGEIQREREAQDEHIRRLELYQDARRILVPMPDRYRRTAGWLP